jgi:ABC-type amino acid transport substrate-binding protein
VNVQAIEGVRGGTTDAFALEWVQAVLTAAEPGNEAFAVAPLDVAANPLAIATPPADEVFAEEVTAALDAVIVDGTWLALFEQWLGGPPLWTVEEMAGVTPS